MKMIVRPTVVQVVVQASGTTAGVSAVAIRAAIIPETIVGRIRRDMNFNATPPGGRRMIVDRFAIGSAILCFRSPREAGPRFCERTR
jgi:hypothetical protein